MTDGVQEPHQPLRLADLFASAAIVGATLYAIGYLKERTKGSQVGLPWHAVTRPIEIYMLDGATILLVWLFRYAGLILLLTGTYRLLRQHWSKAPRCSVFEPQPWYGWLATFTLLTATLETIAHTDGSVPWVTALPYTTPVGMFFVFFGFVLASGWSILTNRTTSNPISISTHAGILVFISVCFLFAASLISGQEESADLAEGCTSSKVVSFTEPPEPLTNDTEYQFVALHDGLMYLRDPPPDSTGEVYIVPAGTGGMAIKTHAAIAVC